MEAQSAGGQRPPEFLSTHPHPETRIADLKAQIPNSVVLDGDEFREYFPAGYEYGAREKNVMRIAKVAAILEKQGTTVIIACVSPYKVLREEAQALFKECIEICMPFGELWEGTEFEEPEHGRET